MYVVGYTGLHTLAGTWMLTQASEASFLSPGKLPEGLRTQIVGL